MPDNYDYSTWVKSKGKIILPADFRTTADNKTDSTFTYHGEGGFSWAIPYLAGLAALSLQINPDLEIEEIYKYLDDSKYITSDGKYVVNPTKFIELIKKTTKEIIYIVISQLLMNGMHGGNSHQTSLNFQKKNIKIPHKT